MCLDAGSIPASSTESQNENESVSDHGVLTFFFALFLFLMLIKVNFSNLPQPRKKIVQIYF